jgi:hypothetical protein
MGANLHSAWVAGFLVVLAQCASARDRMLIQTGWDSPTAAEFRAGLAEFEKWKLFDGAAVVPTRHINEKSVASSAAFSTDHWEWADFAECLRDLQSAQPKSCTNNFLMLTASPGNVGWFDDAGWNEVIDHWRLLARVARQGRMAGILFDPEAYRKPWSQFLYAAQPDKDQHTFPEMSGKARERGRAVMNALGQEYPNITLLAYRLFSDLPHSGDPNDPQIPIESSPYGLLASFVDGWCDALPPGITIVDGNEKAYSYENPDEYYSAFALLKLENRFVSPENRLKLRHQFRVGHGVYLDAYSPAAGAKPRLDFHGQSPSDRLMLCVSAALNAADGPVWIYGESARWWPKPTNRVGWPEKFPGVQKALSAARSPAVFAKDFLADTKPSDNLLRDQKIPNGSKHWSVWQEAKTKGEAALTNGVARFSGMENGSISQNIAVKSGETYAIAASVKSTGRGDVGVSIAWQNKDAKWAAPNMRVEFTAQPPADHDGFRKIVGLVHVPDQAATLTFLFFARQQNGNGEATFKDPILVRVSINR